MCLLVQCEFAFNSCSDTEVALGVFPGGSGPSGNITEDGEKGV